MSLEFRVYCRAFSFFLSSPLLLQVPRLVNAGKHLDAI